MPKEVSRLTQESLDQQVKKAVKLIPVDRPLELHYKVAFVAMCLAKSTKWVKQRIAAGDFDAYLLGHDLVVTLKSINGYLEQCRVTGQAIAESQTDDD